MGDVRTIFLGGLPPDTTERELHLLFYEGGGCEGIRLQYPQPNTDPRSRQGRATAFVQFATRERALTVASWIGGMVFDPADPSSTLRVEMAKQDFRRAGIVSSSGMQTGGTKRTWSQAHDARLAEKDQCTLFLGGLGETVSSAEIAEFAATQEGYVQVSMKDEGSPRAVAWAQYSSRDHAMQALANLCMMPVPSLGHPPNIEAARSNTGEKGMLMNTAQVAGGYAAAPGNGGASSTVFMGALEPQVTEQELKILLVPMDGFVRLTSRGLGQGRGTAWAQFDSPDNAATACVALQSMPVPSMGRPANIEIARADMRSG